MTLSCLLVLIGAPVFGGCGDAGAGSPTTATADGPDTTTTVTSDGTTATTATTTAVSTAQSSTPADGSSSRTTVTYADPAATDTSTPGMSGPLAESNALARELKRALQAANDLVAAHEAAGSPPDDPRLGMIYVLRAYGQALTARRAIVDGQLPLADAAFRQCRKLLTLAAPVDDQTAAAMTRAQATLAQMPVPSQAPDEAASVLDETIQALRPVVPPASAG